MNNSYHLQFIIGSQSYEADLTRTDRTELISLVIAGKGYAITGDDTVSSLVNERLNKLPSNDFENAESFRAVLLEGTGDMQKIQKVAIKKISGEPISSGTMPSLKATVEKTVDCSIIILSGTSSAGKTSIMDAFCRGQSNKVSLGIDDFFADTYLPKLIKNQFPEDYEILCQALEDKDLFEACNPGVSIYEILAKRPDIFRSNVTVEQKNHAIELIADKSDLSFLNRLVDVLEKDEKMPLRDEAHFNEILDQFNSGKTIIFDTVSPGDFFQFIRSKGIKIEDRVNHLLVYLPLEALVDRVEKRNALSIKQGNFSNRRPIVHVLRDFQRHYKKAGLDDKIVGILNRSDIEKIFVKYSVQIEEDNKRVNEVGDPEIKIDEFLEYFQFEEGVDKVALTTNFRIPIGVLFSQNITPSESADQLRKHTFKIIN